MSVLNFIKYLFTRRPTKRDLNWAEKEMDLWLRQSGGSPYSARGAKRRRRKKKVTDEVEYVARGGFYTSSNKNKRFIDEGEYK